MTPDQLNARFALPNTLRFAAGPGDLPMLEVDTEHARARISVYAGQLLSYTPRGSGADLLFLSEQAYFQPGKAIKGGIPLCWPWFGPDPEGRGRPAHGFARNRMWSVLDLQPLDDGAISVTLGLEDDEDTRALWPHRFELRLEFTIGERLTVALLTRNSGDQAFTLTQALHSYFNIGDVDRVSVLGLDGSQYLDKTEEGHQKTQHGPITIAGEVDRIYTDAPADLRIDDPALGRRIAITSSGGRTAVVWSPGAKIAASMADLGDQDYRRMLCVETANAADEVVTIAPGEEYRLGASYRVVSSAG